MSIRYWLMLAVAVTATCLHHELYLLLDVKIVIFGFLLGCLAYVLPMFFFQKAIQKIGNERNSMLIGATPFIVVVLQSLFIKKYSGRFGFWDVYFVIYNNFDSRSNHNI